MEYLNTTIQVLTIMGLIGGLFAAFNKIKTKTAVQDEQLKNQEANVNQIRFEFEKYKDKNDIKFKDMFEKIDEHYRELMKEIREIRKTK